MVTAELKSDAERIDISGETLKGGPTLPEETGLLAKVLGLLLIVWALARKLLFFGVALLVDDPLENDHREAIYEHLLEAGMAHQRAIQRAVDLELSSVQYHLAVLVELSLLTRVESSGYTVYVPRTYDLEDEELRRLALLAQPTRAEIAQALLASGEATQAELAELLDVSRATISRQLSKLVEAALVETEENHNIRYRPAWLLRGWMTGR